MKLGLVARESVRKAVETACRAYKVEFFEIADIYLVEYGLENDYTPCYVFRPQEIPQMIRMLEMTGLLQGKGPEHEKGIEKDALQMIGMKDETWHIVKTEDILFFEARESVVFFYSKEQYYRMNEKLYEVEKRLPKNIFVRISRSYIANIQQVATIAPWFSRRLLLTFENTSVTAEVSRNYVQAFKDFLGMR